MIQAEGDDLAVTWGGDDGARKRADDWIAARCEALGVGPGGEDGAGGARSEDVFVVDSDNVAAGRIFMGMSTQWRVTAMSGMARGVRIKEGLDYAALPVVAGALGVVLDGDCFEGVQCLERLTLGLEANAAKTKARRSGSRGRG
jgi:hypothetical protein